MEEDSLEAVVAEAAAEAAAQGGIAPNGVETVETVETVKAGTHPVTLVSTPVEVQQVGNPMVVPAVKAVRTVTLEAVVVKVIILTIRVQVVETLRKWWRWRSCWCSRRVSLWYKLYAK